MDAKNLQQQITNLRYPSRITVGLKPDLVHSLNAEASTSVTPHLPERGPGLLSSVQPLPPVEEGSGGAPPVTKTKSNLRIRNNGGRGLLYP